MTGGQHRPADTMDEPTTVSELLEKAELQEYCDAFEEEGYDSLSQLRKITENDLVDLIKDYMIENESLRKENYELITVKDMIMRDQEMVCLENEKLIKKVEECEQ